MFHTGFSMRSYVLTAAAVLWALLPITAEFLPYSFAYTTNPTCCNGAHVGTGDEQFSFPKGVDKSCYCPTGTLPIFKSCQNSDDGTCKDTIFENAIKGKCEACTPPNPAVANTCTGCTDDAATAKLTVHSYYLRCGTGQSKAGNLPDTTCDSPFMDRTGCSCFAVFNISPFDELSKEIDVQNCTGSKCP